MADENWKVDGHALVIDCSRSVLEEIRRSAVEGFNSFGHGGLEIGGVLLGVRAGDHVRILNAVPLACEHACGPGFVLSASDTAALQDLLDDRDGPGEPLIPVGWYCSHTRSGIALSEKDVELYERFFPEPWHIALIVKPTRWGPATAGFFFRERGGVLRAGSSYQEFEIEPLREDAAITPPSESEGADPQTEEAANRVAPSEIVESALAEPAGVAAASARSHHAWRWIAVAAAAAAVTLVLLSLARQFMAHPVSQRLGLRTYEIAGQMQIEWDRHAVPIIGASGGVIEINDGGAHTSISLDRNQLRTSNITYAQHSGDVLVRLLLNPQSSGAKAVEELARFVGHPAPAAAEPQPDASAQVTSEPSETTPTPLPEQSLSSKAPRVETAPVAERRPPQKRFTLNPVASIEAPHPPALLSPPPPLAIATVPAPPVPLARAVTPPQPSSIPAPPPYQGPRSGRLVWTGELARRGVVEIDGGQPSVGSLTGTLPGVPVVLRIHPAEFGPGGLVVYTADPGVNRRNELPAASNGWNLTRFSLEPARARELAVLESPNASNGFKRLVLRNDARSCSVILVEWSVQ